MLVLNRYCGRKETTKKSPDSDSVIHMNWNKTILITFLLVVSIVITVRTPIVAEATLQEGPDSEVVEDLGASSIRTGPVLPVELGENSSSDPLAGDVKKTTLEENRWSREGEEYSTMILPPGKSHTHEAPPSAPLTQNNKPARWPCGIPQPVETASTLMIVDNMILYDKNRNRTDSLGEGEDGFLSAEVTNEGNSHCVMTEVEVDFYYIDMDGGTHFIDRDVIEIIQGNGDSETAMVSWKATLLAREIRVIADQDGSDGGPAECIEDVTINPPEYFQILTVPYNRASNYPGSSAEFDIKVLNIGTEIDTVKLRFSGEGNWQAEFEGGTSRKTLSDMESGKIRYVGFSVDIPGNADYTDMRTITITAKSDNNDSRLFSVDLEVFAVHVNRAILVVDNATGDDPPGPSTNSTKLMTIALDDAGYTGMYHVTSAESADYGKMKQYDLVIWVCGYSGGLSTSSMNHLMSYLDDGGALWIMGSTQLRNNEHGMNWYGKIPWELYTDYLNVSFGSPMSRPGSVLNGLPGDAIGNAVTYNMNHIWGQHEEDGSQDWGDALWVKEGDTWADGVFYQGEKFFAVKNWWQKETVDRNPYRTVVCGFDIGQIGAYPVNGSSYHDPERQDLVYRVVSWLGVTPAIPTEDIGVAISEPRGDFVYPDKETTLNITVSNYGLRDHTSSFTVTVDIEENGGTYEETLEKTVSGETILARSLAFPDALSVYIDWDVPSGSDKVYWLNASIGDDDDTTNNEASKRVTAREVTDIVFVNGFRDAKIPYWDCGLAGEPARIGGIFENRGSKAETFDVNIAIREPVGKEELRNWTFAVKALLPGERIEVSRVWTPKLGAGTLDITQSWSRHYTQDPYLIHIGAWGVENDVTPGNNGIHSESPVDDNDGDEASSEGIFFPVAQWAELAESDFYSWTLDNNDSEPDSETSWMTTEYWSCDPTHAFWAGVGRRVEEGDAIYDENAHTRLTSPVIDLKKFSEVRYDFLYGYDLGESTDYGTLLGRYRDSGGESWSEWQEVWNKSSGNGAQGGFLNNGPELEDADGNQYQFRWVFHSDEVDYGHHGLLFDGFVVMAQATNYFESDIGIQGVTAPLVGEAEEQRIITATIYNYGDMDADEYKVNFQVWNKETNTIVYNETLTRSDLACENAEDVAITWTPEDAGSYFVNVTTIFEDRWGANLDEYPSNDFTSLIVWTRPVAHIISVHPNPALETGNISFRGSGGSSYAWRSSIDGEFYNGTEESISHSGLSAGVHVIYLMVGCPPGYWSREDDITLTIHRRPVASIMSITPDPAVTGKKIRFTGMGTDDGTVARYVWYSDIDGELHNSTSSLLLTTTLTPGTHNISLRVMDNHGVWSDENTTTLEIIKKPEAYIESITPNPAVQGTSVRFSGNATSDGNVVRYVWTSNLDGEIANTSSSDFLSSGLSVGVHTISLQIKDNHGFWSEKASTTLTIHERPVAHIDVISPNPALDTETIHFKGEGTDDGDVVRYVWHSSIDGEFYNDTEEEFNYDGLRSGNHTIYFKIQDDKGGWSEEVTAQLRVINPPPQAYIDSIWPSPALDTGTVNFRGRGTDNGEVVRYVWMVGDVEVYNGTEKNFLHDALPAGTYAIHFFIQDNSGAWSDKVSKSFIVHERPTAEITLVSPHPAVDTDTVEFIGGTDDGTVERYVWISSIDGKIHNETQSDFTSSSLSVGTHTISLKVQDNYGVWSNEVSTGLTVFENDPPEAHINSVTPNPAHEDDDIHLAGNGTDDGEITGWCWRSEIDGILSIREKTRNKKLFLSHDQRLSQIPDQEGDTRTVKASYSQFGSDTRVNRRWTEAGIWKLQEKGELTFSGNITVSLLYQELDDGYDNDLQFRFSLLRNKEGLGGATGEIHKGSSVSVRTYTVSFALGETNLSKDDTLELRIDYLGWEDCLLFFGGGYQESGVVFEEWEWVMNGETGDDVIVSGLTPGNHTLHFSVQDDHGVWSEEEETELVVKEPAPQEWYEKPVFQGVCGLTLVVIAVVAILVFRGFSFKREELIQKSQGKEQAKK